LKETRPLSLAQIAGKNAGSAILKNYKFLAQAAYLRGLKDYFDYFSSDWCAD
jgi:hypothetical protein